MKNTATTTVPNTTYNYVRQSWAGEWHIAGSGRKPAAKALCGVKRVKELGWVDSRVTPPTYVCFNCEAQA